MAASAVGADDAHDCSLLSFIHVAENAGGYDGKDVSFILMRCGGKAGFSQSSLPLRYPLQIIARMRNG